MGCSSCGNKNEFREVEKKEDPKDYKVYKEPEKPPYRSPWGIPRGNS